MKLIHGVLSISPIPFELKISIWGRSVNNSLWGLIAMMFASTILVVSTSAYSDENCISLPKPIAGKIELPVYQSIPARDRYFNFIVIKYGTALLCSIR